jgi:hypothetical protein
MRILYGFKIENANRSGDRRTGNKRRKQHALSLEPQGSQHQVSEAG